jgi:hypothetical protein
LPIFDLVFFSDFQVDDEEVDVALLKGNNNEYLSYSDLPTRAKAEALIPILVACSLSLASSPYKHIVQDIFGRLVFQNRSSYCGFFVTQKGSVSLLTPQAMSYLNGRSLMNLMGVPEEAFIRFVIITDFLRYHFHMVSSLSNKYRHLLSAKDSKNIDTLLKDYDGVQARNRPEKGFRNRDIRFFQEIKTNVMAERQSMTSDSSAQAGKSEVKHALEKQFIFHYQGKVINIKKESGLDNNNSRKRKATRSENPFEELPFAANHESLSMPLTHDDYHIDYKSCFSSSKHISM